MAGTRLGPRRRGTVGSAPGSLIPDPQARPPSIHVISFGPDDFAEMPDCDIGDAIGARGKAPVTWIDITGLADTGLIRRIGDAFGLHGLALEDVVNVHQRPKAEAYEDHLFIVLRMLVHGREPATEQIALFVGEGYVISFQERRGDCLEPVRERLRHGRGRLKAAGADYLGYAMIDAVIDGYFPVLEAYGEEIEALEDRVVARFEREQAAWLHRVKRNLLHLRRAVWPTRDLVSSLIRDETPLITAQTRIYLRDAYDHTIQLMDLVETYREITSGLVDVYLSSQGARMNEIMMVLTVIATIFIPLGFLASLWGMNFDRSSPWNMPELGWRLGYPGALALMAFIAAMLLWWFRRRGWLEWERPGWRRTSRRRRYRHHGGDGSGSPPGQKG